MGKRVLMLLSNDFVSDPRVEKEAVALITAGHSVTVLAWNRSGTALADEERGGFRIIRIGPPAPHGGGIRNVSLYRAFWRECVSRAVGLDPNVVHCHDADTIPAGRRVVRQLRSRGGNARLVVDFHELYRDSKMVPQRGLVGAIARKLVQRVERAGVREAALVIVANPGTADYYSALGGGKDALVVENAPDAELFKPHEYHPAGAGDFTVCYIGQKRYLRNLEVLMEAVQGLDGVRAYLGGGGVDAEAVAQIAAGLERVDVEGRLSYAEIPGRYEACDAVYAINDVHVGNMRVNFPVKAMEGMACGLPVLVNRDTWIGGYVEESRVGLAVDGDDVGEVARALAQLRDDPALARQLGERGRTIVESGLNWTSAAARLVRVYETFDEKGDR